MKYKVKYESGIRPLIKEDLKDLIGEVQVENKIYYNEDIWCPIDYEITNINTIKSKLLKAMFPTD